MSETSPEALRERLIHLLKTHDWYYQYSDDHSVWSRGSRQREEIWALVPKVPDGDTLFDQYRPS